MTTPSRISQILALIGRRQPKRDASPSSTIVGYDGASGQHLLRLATGAIKAVDLKTNGAMGEGDQGFVAGSVLIGKPHIPLVQEGQVIFPTPPAIYPFKFIAVENDGDITKVYLGGDRDLQLLVAYDTSDGKTLQDAAVQNLGSDFLAFANFSDGTNTIIYRWSNSGQSTYTYTDSAYSTLFWYGGGLLVGNVVGYSGSSSDNPRTEDATSEPVRVWSRHCPAPDGGGSYSDEWADLYTRTVTSIARDATSSTSYSTVSLDLKNSAVHADPYSEETTDYRENRSQAIYPVGGFFSSTIENTNFCDYGEICTVTTPLGEFSFRTPRCEIYQGQITGDSPNSLVSAGSDIRGTQDLTETVRLAVDDLTTDRYIHIVINNGSYTTQNRRSITRQLAGISNCAIYSRGVQSTGGSTVFADVINVAGVETDLPRQTYSYSPSITGDPYASTLLPSKVLYQAEYPGSIPTNTDFTGSATKYDFVADATEPIEGQIKGFDPTGKSIYSISYYPL